MVGACCDYELCSVILAKKTRLTMKWSIDTDSPVVLHAKPQLVKNQVYVLTWQLHHNSENVE